MIQPDSQEVITAFIDTIHPNFDYVVGTSAFSSCLLTLLVVLLAFSTKESRRHLVFYLNVLAICLALTFGMLIGVTNGAIILDPFHLVSKDVYITAIAFAAFAPLFYDSILLFRLFLLYPPAITPKATQLKIFAFPFFIKCARIIVMSLLLNHTKAATSTATLIQYAIATRFRNPYAITGLSMQLADNIYTLSFFLYKFHVRTLNIERTSAIAERLRQVFFVSVANFVFPLLFNIAQIIYMSVSRRTSVVTMLILISNHVSVVGILCATIWFSGMDWAHAHSDSLARLPHPDRATARRGVSDGQNGNVHNSSLTSRFTDSSPRVSGVINAINYPSP